MIRISEREAPALSDCEVRHGAMAATVIEWTKINSGSCTLEGLAPLFDKAQARARFRHRFNGHGKSIMLMRLIEEQLDGVTGWQV
jgi:hypothetical protein